MGCAPADIPRACRFDLLADGTSAAGEVLYADNDVYVTPAFVDGKPDPDHLLVVTNRHGAMVLGMPSDGWRAALPHLIAAMPCMDGVPYSSKPSCWIYYLEGEPAEDGTPGSSGRTISYHDHLHVVARLPGRPSSGMSPSVAAAAYDAAWYAAHPGVDWDAYNFQHRR
jgi:hypothetical protein